MVRLERLTWPDLASSEQASTVLVIAVGSIEQHGPHLPLNTDTRIASAVATAAVEAANASATQVQFVLGPALPYGNSGEHEDFPGTISMGAQALHLVLVELARSATRWAQAVVFINGHGGNTVTGRAAVAQLQAESRVVLWADCTVPDGDAHAGATETGIMSALDPEAVNLARVEVGQLAPLSQLLPALRQHGVRAVSANGILGDPRRAEASRGERDLHEMTQRIGASLEQAAQLVLAHSATNAECLP